MKDFIRKASVVFGVFLLFIFNLVFSVSMLNEASWLLMGVGAITIFGSVVVSVFMIKRTFKVKE